MNLGSKCHNCDCSFSEYVFAEEVSTHESVFADVDIDILTKPWNGNEHVFAENLLIGE